jgi:hypothetical protein
MSTRITKSELITALSAAGDELRAARVRIAELEGDVAARDARLARAVEAFRAVRAERDGFEADLVEARTERPTTTAAFQPHWVGRPYTRRDGVTYCKWAVAFGRTVEKRVELAAA